MIPEWAYDWGVGDRRRIPGGRIPEAVKALVDERQGGRFCVACRLIGQTPPPGEPLELDHLQPLSKGGDNSARNLRWLCRSHNAGRGARKRPPKEPAWLRRERARGRRPRG